MSLAKSFVNENRRLAYKFTPSHFRESGVFAMYRRCGLLLLGRTETRVVLDVGAGRSWQFDGLSKSDYGIRLIGVDIDADEMAGNESLDEAIVADVTVEIPVDPGSVDLVMCHSGIEHFRDNQAFLGNAYKALAPGGRLVAQFPSPTAPFAVLNRVLPERVKRWLLHNLIPGSDGILGFEAHYDRTRPDQFQSMAEALNFEVEHHVPGYFSAAYFAFFLPFYFVALAYDLVRFSLGIRPLASYSLFILQKPGGEASSAIRW